MIGSQISHYRILSKIGKGGMGEVYLAEDLQLDRKVALKFLPDGQVPDETSRRRLLREANAAARLDHPFITKVYEVGQGDAAPGIPFIAMELVEGETLRERLTRGPLSLPDALRIASEIADALEFARQRGIVHRDLKPANVMLTGDGHAKVMDFGIAKYVSIPSADGSRSDGPSMTSTGEITGTPAYMAPEQLKGLPLDSRADIFALGVCLYEMVTGAHPFMKDTGFAMADAILNQPAPPLDRYLKDPPEGLEHVFRGRWPRSRISATSRSRIFASISGMWTCRRRGRRLLRRSARGPGLDGSCLLSSRSSPLAAPPWRGGCGRCTGYLAAGAGLQRARLDSDR